MYLCSWRDTLALLSVSLCFSTSPSTQETLVSILSQLQHTSQSLGCLLLSEQFVLEVYLRKLCLVAYHLKILSCFLIIVIKGIDFHIFSCTRDHTIDCLWQSDIGAIKRNIQIIKGGHGIGGEWYVSFDVCWLMLVLLGRQNWNTCAEEYRRWWTWERHERFCSHIAGSSLHV